MHGANRLGGNGVANSTVFGGIAGDTMAAWLARDGAWREPDPTALDAAIARGEAPFRGHRGDVDALEAIRERLFAVMWDDAGIVRNAAGLERADRALGELETELEATSAVGGDRRAFNLTWHDWLNLASLIDVAQVIVRAAQRRENSRGAHFRDDFPDAGALETSAYTRIRRSADGALAAEHVPVRFTRVRPGESLIA